MKNILVLLGGYLPNASANGVCCENIVRELINEGYSVDIVACPYDDKKDEIIDGISVHYIDHFQNKSKGIFAKFWYYIKYIFFHSRYPITEIKEKTRSYINVSSKVIEDKNIDTVVCVHLPVETLIAGIELKKMYPEIKYLSYMLDSLSGGFVPRLLPEKFSRAKKTKWENNLLKEFDHNILMEASRNHHENISKKEMWYKNAVYSDIPLFNAKYNSKMVEKKSHGDNVYMSFVGTIGEGVRTPYHFLKVLRCVKDINIIFRFAGKNNCDEAVFSSLVEDLEKNDNIKVEQLGILSHEEAIAIVEDSDILVNFGNTISTMVPSKIFEYMSYGKPIVATLPNDNDPCLPYLKKYPMALLLEEKKSNIQMQADKLAVFIRKNKGVSVNVKEYENILYNNTPRAFVELVKCLLDKQL